MKAEKVFMKNENVVIPGDYQYRALVKGNIIQRFWHKSKLNLLEKIGGFSAEDIVLDAGCGSGNAIFFLAKKVNNMVGLDNNEKAIIFAKNKARQLKLTNVTFKLADLRRIPFKEKYFTKAILFEVVEHFTEKDYKKIIFEIYRVLKAGGLLYITVPNKISSWPIIEFVLDTFKLVPHLGGSQHISELTLFQLEKIVAEENFKLRNFGSINHLSPFISLFSKQLANIFFDFEVRYLKKFGPIIWLVAEKC